MADNNLTTKEEFLLNPVEEHNITDAVVASFETNLKHPLKVTVPMTPIQDLHGYDHPWPACGSVNLIPDGTDTSNGYVANSNILVDGSINAATNWYISEYFEVDENTTYTWSNRINTNVGVSICFYDENKEFISGVAINGEYSQTFTPPAGTVYARSSQTTYEFQIANPTGAAYQLEVGSTATEYRRYSNICPIEGYTSDTITRKGKNLYIYATNTPREVSHTRYAYPYGSSNQGRYVYLKPGTYTITFYKQSGANVTVGMYRSINGGAVGRVGENASWSTKVARTIVSTGAWYNFYLYGSGLDASYTYYFQIELGSASTSYEPYKNQAIPITFTNPSTGDPMTVYGASLTLNEDGSADLIRRGTVQTFTGYDQTANRVYSRNVDLDYFDTGGGGSVVLLGAYTKVTFSRNKNGPHSSYNENSSSYLHNYCNYAPHLVSNVGQSLHWYRTTSGLYLFAPSSVIGTTKAQVVSYIHDLMDTEPLSFWIEYATPITYHFPNVGQLKAFLGENNVWSDIGNVNVKYLTQHSETGLEYRGDRALELRRRAMMADAPTIHTTVGSEETGGLASFKSYVKAPVKKIEIPFSPKQDLNGYDHPWPAGGGKNIWEPKSDTNNGITFTPQSDGTVQISGTYTSNGRAYTYGAKNIPLADLGLSVGDIIYLKCEPYGIVSGCDSNNSRLFQKPSSGNLASVSIPEGCTYLRTYQYAGLEEGVAGDSVNTIGRFLLTKDSTVTEWTPYENICPIEGHDGCNVKQQGKNLFDINNNPSESLRSFYGRWLRGNGYNGVAITVNENTITFVHGKNSDLAVLLGYFKAGSGPFYLSEGEITGGSKFVYIARTDSLIAGAGRIVVTSDRLFYPNVDGYYWAGYSNYPTGVAFAVSNIQLEAKIEATDYEPCKKSIVPLIFNQSGDHAFLPIQEGTGNPSPENVRPIHPGLTFTRDDDSVLSVYGGTLTVNADGTGSLVNELGIFTSNDSTGWTVFGSGGFFYENALNTDILTGTYEAPFRCNKYILATAVPNSSFVNERADNTYFTQTKYPKRLWIKDTSLDDTLESLNASLTATPLQVSYPLAEPVTYTLSVTETNRALEALGLTQHIGPLYGGTITINPDGSADVVNNVRRMILDGTESWVSAGTATERYMYRRKISSQASTYSGAAKCSHFGYAGVTSTNTLIGFAVSVNSAYGGDQLFIRPGPSVTQSSDVTEFKAWLATQYANGTPVEVIATVQPSAQTTYHFSNLEQLKVWLGENNFWCDISDDITVKYWNRG